jgi:hypothetical protein
MFANSHPDGFLEEDSNQWNGLILRLTETIGFQFRMSVFTTTILDRRGCFETYNPAKLIVERKMITHNLLDQRSKAPQLRVEK